MTTFQTIIAECDACGKESNQSEMTSFHCFDSRRYLDGSMVNKPGYPSDCPHCHYTAYSIDGIRKKILWLESDLYKHREGSEDAKDFYHASLTEDELRKRLEEKKNNLQSLKEFIKTEEYLATLGTPDENRELSKLKFKMDSDSIKYDSDEYHEIRKRIEELVKKHKRYLRIALCAEVTEDFLTAAEYYYLTGVYESNKQRTRQASGEDTNEEIFRQYYRKSFECLKLHQSKADTPHEKSAAVLTLVEYMRRASFFKEAIEEAEAGMKVIRQYLEEKAEFPEYSIKPGDALKILEYQQLLSEDNDSFSHYLHELGEFEEFKIVRSCRSIDELLEIIDGEDTKLGVVAVKKLRKDYKEDALGFLVELLAHDQAALREEAEAQLETMHIEKDSPGSGESKYLKWYETETARGMIPVLIKMLESGSIFQRLNAARFMYKIMGSDAAPYFFKNLQHLVSSDELSETTDKVQTRFDTRSPWWLPPMLLVDKFISTLNDSPGNFPAEAELFKGQLQFFLIRLLAMLDYNEAVPFLKERYRRINKTFKPLMFGYLCGFSGADRGELYVDMFTNLEDEFKLALECALADEKDPDQLKSLLMMIPGLDEEEQSTFLGLAWQINESAITVLLNNMKSDEEITFAKRLLFQILQNSYGKAHSSDRKLTRRAFIDNWEWTPALESSPFEELINYFKNIDR